MLEVIIRPIRISYLSTIIYNNKLGGKFWSCDNYISTDRFNFLVERPANRQLRLGINSNSNIIHFLFNVFSFNWSRFAFCGFWFPWQCSNDSSSKWPSIMSFPLHSFLLPFILYFSLSLFPHSFCFFFLFFTLLSSSISPSFLHPTLPLPPQGEYIDITIGVTLGISTMAAAAFGNLISDLSGLGYEQN